MNFQSNNDTSIPPNGKKGGRGCLKPMLIALLIGVALLFFPLLWIPAIIMLIVFIIRKDSPHRKRNVLISLGIALVSFVSLFLLPTPDLTGIDAKWETTSFDINDDAVVEITPIPSGANITNLEISDSSCIAEMNYKNGKATITFSGEGSADLYFTCNGIKSNVQHIKIVDKEALAQREAEKKAEEEAKKKAEEEAKKQAEEEAKRQAEEEAKRQAEEEAQKKAEEEAQRQAEEEAQRQAEEEARQAAASQEPQEKMVWIPQSGSKYHSRSSCSNMNNPTQVTESEAIARGYTPCKKCH